MKKIKYKKGLTLIELLVAIVASAIVILTVAVILIMALRSWRINNAYVDLRRDTALAVYLMSRDVRESNIADIDLSVANQLQLPAVTNTYRKNGAALESDNFGTIIPRGVLTFDPDPGPTGSDGVYLTLVVANNNAGIGIAITNKVFVNTRN